MNRWSISPVYLSIKNNKKNAFYCTNFDIKLAFTEKVVYIKKYFVFELKFSDVRRCGISGITLRLKI